MELLKPHEAKTHEYNDGAVRVTEFNFKGTKKFNDAEIVISGRYPTEDYAVNDVSTVLISVDEGEGSITVKDSPSAQLLPGDRLTINPGEPYYFIALGRITLRYVATPAWTKEQQRIVK